MPFRKYLKLDKLASSILRTLKYAYHDWTREMPKSKRVIAFAALSCQGYALYALWARSLIWPWIWPREQVLYPCVWTLDATGVPLGLFVDANYRTDTATLARGHSLLAFTDGLTDSIGGDQPEERLRDVLADSSQTIMSNLKALVKDDVTGLLIKRMASSVESKHSLRPGPQ